MRMIILYTATSLNGKIALKDVSVDWLEEIPNPEKTDYGYAEFYQSVDTTIMGFKTYKQIMDWRIDIPYRETKNYVFSRNKTHQNNEHVEFIAENHFEFVNELKAKKGKDIWLIGGGQINSMMLNAGFIDEIRVFLMPIILPEGIELFEVLPDQTLLKLKGSKSYPIGVVELTYSLIKN